jgi:hypothetical protein
MYAEAISKYSEAIAEHEGDEPGLATLYSNRAAAHIKLVRVSASAVAMRCECVCVRAPCILMCLRFRLLTTSFLYGCGSMCHLQKQYAEVVEDCTKSLSLNGEAKIVAKAYVTSPDSGCGASPVVLICASHA